MLRYFVLNLGLVLLVWQVCCNEEPANSSTEDEDNDLDYQDLNDTDTYFVPRPRLIQVRASEKSYSLNFVYVNWHTARELCATQNQVLASVKNMQESEALLSAMLKYGVYNSDVAFWLGGSQLGHIGQWSWLSNGLPIRNIDWRYNSQSYSNCNKNCLEISSRGQFNANDCDLKRPFVCEDLPGCP